MARRILVGLVFIAAAIAAVIGSGGATVAPASTGWTVAGAIAAAALGALAIGRGRGAWLAGVAALGVLALVATQAHLGEGFPRTHDGRLHLWSMWSVHRCWLDGDLFPRWNPYLGLGYPLLQFYPPLSYMAAQPLLSLGMSPVQAGATLMLLASWGAGLSAAWSAGRLGVGRAGQLAAGAALMLAPYRLHDVSYRFALAEVVAFVWLPAFLVLGRELVLGSGEPGRPGRLRRGTLAAFVAVAVGLLLTHLLTALMAGIAVGLWCAVEVPLRSRRRPLAAAGGLARLGLACALAAGLCGAFLAPALGEMNDTAIGRFLPGDERPLSRNAVAFDDLFERYAWVGYAAKRTRLPEGKDPNHVIPMYAGLALLACPLAALAWTARRRWAEGDPGPRPAAVVALAAVTLACLGFAAGFPAPLLDGISPLRALQFPWRFLGVASVGAALAAGVAVEGLARRPRAQRLWLALAIAALVADAFPYLGSVDRHDAYQGATHQVFRGKGRTWADRHHPVDAQLPRDEFVRVQWLRFPPSDFGWRVAQAHRSHREYMTPRIFRDYVKQGVRAHDLDVAASFGVAHNYRSGAADPDVLDARALAQLRPEGDDAYADLAQPPHIEPERLVVTLPDDHPAGRLRLLFQAFDGWMVRTDGGPWRPARSSRGLLATDVAAGDREIEFRYGWRTPSRRAGLGMSGVAWGGVLVWCGVWGRRWWKRRA